MEYLLFKKKQKNSPCFFFSRYTHTQIFHLCLHVINLNKVFVFSTNKTTLTFFLFLFVLLSVQLYCDIIHMSLSHQFNCWALKVKTNSIIELRWHLDESTNGTHWRLLPSLPTDHIVLLVCVTTVICFQPLNSIQQALKSLRGEIIISNINLAIRLLIYFYKQM